MGGLMDKIGTTIVGTYCGVPYHGIIEKARVYHDGIDIQYTVRLSEPVEVYDEYRTILLIRKDLDRDNYQLG